MITDLGVVGEPAPPAGEPPSERRPRPWERPEIRRRVLIGVIVVWAVAITAVVLFRGDGAGEQAARPAPAPSPSASDAPLGPPEVYQTLLPSVVRIEAEGEGRANDQSAVGTGVIVNADGTILTARHVVAGADAITVLYADGGRSAAAIAGEDPKQDIATLTPKTLPETVVPAALGGGVRVGDDVVAIGNPLGLTASTTDGVVSGLERSARGEGGSMSGLIQFDAAVNPGSSGGPLINDRAQVVGIVVSLANPTDAGTFIGIGFAVPIGAALGGGGDGDGRGPPL
ncbi:trypsin-like peptidase domain-containing protein [Actinoplanes sp. NBRC 103695]|uniref:S1C family serine protease n=1 Tax=Actinoplanes sp. NBRC 103695 TaxID=3032202 RepID=UPI0025554E59|nr:trypsin-like peptidase domain-containing protein [Actinoplanes sp. NBRC 103695]